jgi:hypothetical protein
MEDAGWGSLTETESSSKGNGSVNSLCRVLWLGLWSAVPLLRASVAVRGAVCRGDGDGDSASRGGVNRDRGCVTRPGDLVDRGRAAAGQMTTLGDEAEVQSTSSWSDLRLRY